MGATSTIPELPRTVGYRDLAKVLRVHPETIRRWAREGQIPAPRKIGRRVYWTPEDLRPLFADGDR